MSEEKDRVDGTADETKAETKSSDHHTEDTYEKSASCAADRRAKPER